MKRTATTVVNLVRKPIAPELPKIVWLAPPKAAPISAPFPACRRTIRMSAKQTMMWITVITVTEPHFLLLDNFRRSFYISYFFESDNP
jgi:hypothetical protein